MSTLIGKQESSERINSWLIFFVLIDILFLLRIMPLFGIPISSIIVILVILSRPIKKTTLLTYLVLMIIALFSLMNGSTYKSDFVFIEDIKRFSQLFLSLLYAFLLFKINKNESVLLSKILALFFWYSFLFMVLFKVDPNFYISIFGFIYPESLEAMQENITMGRYALFFGDPNTAGYFFVFAYFLYTNLNKNIRNFNYLYILVLILVASTLSRGAFVSFGILSLYLLKSLETGKIIKYIFLILFLAMLDFLIRGENSLFLQILNNISLRIESDIEKYGSGFGGRVHKYISYFESFDVNILGEGYVIIKDGMEFRPHSDLLRFLHAYGLIFLIIFFYFFLWRSARNLKIIFLLFCIPFMINSIFDEFKLPMLIFLTLALINPLTISNKPNYSS